MMYKLAAEKSKKKKEYSAEEIKQMREDARKRVRLGLLSNIMDSGTAVSGINRMAVGYLSGKKSGHEIIGTMYGPIGINGAIAKETGVSTLGPTTAEAATIGGLYGGGLGALAGGLIGMGHGPKGLLLGTGLGALASGATGAALGGLAGALNYGLGYATQGDIV